uniref:Peptidase S1 domain-containing protein n=1 Tax=Steinernema glaseri TaxID=37863 RepID=A0A1I7YZE8_9BILA
MKSIAVLLVSHVILSATAHLPLHCGITNKTKSTSFLNTMLLDYKIAGGIESVAHAWPWAGQLVSKQGGLCGCALISERFVLTAAHCIRK